MSTYIHEYMYKHKHTPASVQKEGSQTDPLTITIHQKNQYMCICHYACIFLLNTYIYKCACVYIYIYMYICIYI